MLSRTSSGGSRRLLSNKPGEHTRVNRPEIPLIVNSFLWRSDSTRFEADAALFVRGRVVVWFKPILSKGWVVPSPGGRGNHIELLAGMVILLSMPIYEFHCDKCESDSEVLVRSSNWKGTKCPKCGSSKLSKKLSTFASQAGSSRAPQAPACAMGGGGGCCGGHCGGHRH